MAGEGDGHDNQGFDAGNDAAGVVFFFQSVGHAFGGSADGYGRDAHTDGYVGIGRAYILRCDLRSTGLAEIVGYGEGATALRGWLSRSSCGRALE